MGAPSPDLVSGPELSSHTMKSSLVLILLSPLLTTSQDSQEEEELVITVGDLVKMYNEEEEGAVPVSRQTKQTVKQESVDFNSVAGTGAV